MLRVMAIVHQRPSITRHNTVLTAIFWEIQVKTQCLQSGFYWS